MYKNGFVIKVLSFHSLHINMNSENLWPTKTLRQYAKWLPISLSFLTKKNVYGSCPLLTYREDSSINIVSKSSMRKALHSKSAQNKWEQSGILILYLTKMFRSLTAHRIKNVFPHAASILLSSQGIRALTEVLRSCLSTGSVYRGLPEKNKLRHLNFRQKM